MDYETKQREAFYLIKKYSSYTWYEEIFRLWTKFCMGYEDMLRHPPAGYPVTDWDDQNFRMFWGYAADMEDGLTLLAQNNKARGYEYLASGYRFGTWLYSRRFDEIDLSEFGYRHFKADGANQGIFAFAEQARDMAVESLIFAHTDRLRRDILALPDKYFEEQDIPIAAQFKTPFGVPPGELPPLPPVDPNAPTVISGEDVPMMGIWVVEPDRAHREQTYCMAYLRPWAPAIETVSEQEYEINSRWSRTRDEKYRKDYNKFKDYPVRWRLLWRDERDYSDGRRPAEEAEYLIYRGVSVATPQPERRLRCESGQTCPQDGWWFTPSGGGVRRHFKQGQIMDDLHSAYGATIWQFEAEQQGEA